MATQTYEIKFSDILWTPEYAGWIGIYQNRTDTDIITLHFGTDYEPRSLFDNAKPEPGYHPAIFLKGTHSFKDAEGKWDQEFLVPEFQSDEYHVPAIVSVLIPQGAVESARLTEGMTRAYMTGILNHKLSAREARKAAKMLKEAGYLITIDQCNNHLPNIIGYCEPSSIEKQRELARKVSVAIGLQPA